MVNDKREKWKQTMLNRFGGDEAKLKEHLSAIGRRGGQNGNTGGFAANRELASRVGKIGGSSPRRKRERRDTV